MTSKARSSTRDRLLAATWDLTYRDGVGIGIEALCSEAGVSKRSLYQLFASKDALLAASLEWGVASYMAEFLPPGEDGAPRRRIQHVFDQVESHAASPDYLGCRYLAAQVELKDVDHPASVVAREVKAHLTSFFRAEAVAGGSQDPDLLARQLSLLFDGASVRAGIRADHLRGLVGPTVALLLDAAGVR